MNPQNALSAAKGAMQSLPQQASAPAAPLPAQAPMPQPNLPVPPPQVALQLAKQAATMPPMVLGTLIWRGLAQHGQAIGNVTKHFGGQPQGAPMMGGTQ